MGAARPNTLPRHKRGRGGAVEEGYGVEEGYAATLFLAFTAIMFIEVRQGRGTCHFGAQPELATLLPHTVLGPREHLSTERVGDTGAYRVLANMRTRERSGVWRLCPVPFTGLGMWHVEGLGLRSVSYTELGVCLCLCLSRGLVFVCVFHGDLALQQDCPPLERATL